MVQRVTTERFDDLDGSPAVETVRFGYAGRNYEIDLNEEHASQLDEVLARYLEHARRAGGERNDRADGDAGVRLSGGLRRSSEPSGSGRGNKAMQVSDRGRIAADIMAKYDAAH